MTKGGKINKRPNRKVTESVFLNREIPNVFQPDDVGRSMEQRIIANQNERFIDTHTGIYSFNDFLIASNNFIQFYNNFVRLYNVELIMNTDLDPMTIDLLRTTCRAFSGLVNLIRVSGTSIAPCLVLMSASMNDVMRLNYNPEGILYSDILVRLDQKYGFT